MRSTCLAVLTAALVASGDGLRVVSYDASGVNVGFEFRATNACGSDGTVFGVTVAEGARPTGASVTIDDAAGKAGISVLAGGWIGADFVQWYRIGFTGTSSMAAEEDLVSGVARLRFEGAVFRTGTPVTGSCRGAIVRLPVSQPLGRRQVVSRPTVPYRRGVRMGVSQDGVYRIKGSQLRGIGVPIDQVPTSSYRLYNRTKEVPILVLSLRSPYLRDGDEILFYGRGLRGQERYYTDYDFTNVYWLIWNTGAAGARVAEVSGSRRREEKVYIDPTSDEAGLLPREFLDTVHIEHDNDIRWLAELRDIENVEDEPTSGTLIDSWYWDIVGDKEFEEYEFALAGPSRTSSRRPRIRVAFTGLTSIDTANPDHHVGVILNGFRLPGQARWDGQADYVYESVVTDSLVHGINKIVFEVPSRAYEDRAALNWIEVAYVRDHRAYGNQLVFKTNPEDRNSLYEFELEGFSTTDLELWDTERNRYFSGFETRLVRRQSGPSISLVFQDSIVSPTRFHAQARSLRRTPGNMSLDTIRQDWDFSGGVDYVMISDGALLPILAPLANAHEKGGLKVALVNIRDIYNAFSYGIRDPESIRTMLKYVFGVHADSPPRYLLLAGDATHDLYKKNPGATVVPTRLTQVPGWGLAADDSYFGTVKGEDNFCDMMVGRLPARGAADLSLLVDKTVGYISGLETGYWKDNLLAAGGIDREFTAYNDEVVGEIAGPRMHVLRMDADPKSPYYNNRSVAASRIAGHINAGIYALNFAGHGGGAIWSDSYFFSYSDLSRLRNEQWPPPGRLPIVLSFTCLTGFFESSFYRSLGEEFVRSGPGGAIAFYGGSGYSRKSADIALSRMVLTNGLRWEYESLGELLSLAEASTLVRSGSNAIAHVRQYNLLGDPALPWKLTPDTLKLHVANRSLQGIDTLRITGETAPVTAGQVKVRVSSQGTEWAEATVAVKGGTFALDMPIKESARTASGLIRAYAWNSTSEVRGWTTFAKDTIALSDVTIDPPMPALGDSVLIRCRIVLAPGAQQVPVQCLHAIDFPTAAAPDFSTTVSMVRDTAAGSDSWVSVRPVRVGSADMELLVGQTFLVKFRVSNALGESAVFRFAVHGRPDLLFTNDTLKAFWDGESLRVVAEILNKGNAPSPPFRATFFLGDTQTDDTLHAATTTNDLPVGGIVRYTFTVPDTQGFVSLRALVNAEGSVNEIRLDNNLVRGYLRIVYADLRGPSDSLVSEGGGLVISPRDTLRTPVRLFLISDEIAARQPLPSPSSWLPLRGDGTTAFSVGARPALTHSDTLVWSFFPDPAGLGKSGTFAATGPKRIQVFVSGSVDSEWRNAGGSWFDAARTCRFVTSLRGSLALGTIEDTAGPTVQAFVGGREIVFVDYAAKGKPFTFLIHDESGVDPASLRLLLNGVELADKYRSSVAAGDDPATVTVTAYPPPASPVDSLTVEARDYAANHTASTFAYMPGEDLKIKFFSCHPNPFTVRKTAATQKKVRFAYLLTDVADRVTLRIHAMGGPKVWTWRNQVEQIGYQEIVWDGITTSGHRIANGTYYAKLTVSNKHKRAEKIIRIAKLEGY